MINPAVKVTLLGDDKDKEEVRKTSQDIIDSLLNNGWKGHITEITLLGQLLGQCGAKFEY